MDFVGATVIGPLLAGGHHTAFEIQQTPAARRQTALGLLRVDDLPRAQGRVILQSKKA